MTRSTKSKGGGGARTASVKKATRRTVSKRVAPKTAEAYYFKAARTGKTTNDLVHIVIPDLYEGAKVTKPIDVRIGQSIPVGRKKAGMVVTGVHVDKIAPGTFKGNVRGRGIGQVVVEINRPSALTTDDALEGIMSRLLPKIPIGAVKYVSAASDLPGKSTGPGVGDLPPRPPAPDEPGSGNPPPASGTPGGSGSGNDPKKDEEQDEKKDKEQKK